MTPPSILPQDRTAIVGVLNTTPDSFSDGGRFVDEAEALDLEAACAAGLALVRDGADWIDVGGESTRPGAAEVPVEAEIARTRPVVAALAKHTDAPLSIDTRKAAVAEAALEAGARVVNDVSGLAHDPDLAAVAARHGAWVVVGHLRGEPASMQQAVHFDDVLREVADELAAGVERALAAGVPRGHVVVDPGIGFGKEREHNLVLVANVDRLARRLGLPVMLGVSRKRFLGQLSGRDVGDRDLESHAACAVAVFAGASAVRVHDVAGARRAVRVAQALRDVRRTAA